MEPCCIITTVCNNKDIATRIIQVLLDKRLVSCCQTYNIDSAYWWQGKIDRELEILIQLKTRKSLYKEVETEILKLHDYEVCEIICVDITDGDEKYLKWIIDETKNPD